MGLGPTASRTAPPVASHRSNLTLNPAWTFPLSTRPPASGQAQARSQLEEMLEGLVRAAERAQQLRHGYDQQVLAIEDLRA